MKAANTLETEAESTIVMKHESGLLRRGVMRMLQSKLAGGFGRWREWALLQAAMLGLAGRVVARMRNGALSAGWNTWRGMFAKRHS